MSRALALITSGCGAFVLFAMVMWGAFAPMPLGAYVAAIFLGVVTASLLGARTTRQWLGDRRREANLRLGAVDASTARRLMGDYSPYVIEAAQEVGRTGNPAATPLLCHEIERLMADRPPGWHEMAVAIAEALGAIGDGRCLPLLRRLHAIQDIDEISRMEMLPRLESVIASLEEAGKLLRPTEADEASLLRPAEGQATDPASLLRAGDPGPSRRNPTGPD